MAFVFKDHSLSSIDTAHYPEPVSSLEALESDASLYEGYYFYRRTEAIDMLEFQIIGYLDHLLTQCDESEKAKLQSLRLRAEKLKTALEECNATLFHHLRSEIAVHGYRGESFLSLVKQYIDLSKADDMASPDYDTLDLFIDGLLTFHPLPSQDKAIEPEMVFYQKTPARVVLEIVREAAIQSSDVFFDVGAGLGQVVMLVQLLTECTVTAIEYEPAFSKYAQRCAHELHLSNIDFITTDAREADYSEATVLFLYTPFKGEMLRQVLERIRCHSMGRSIKILTYGPCTIEVAPLPWLEALRLDLTRNCELGIFRTK